jgi:hypothetical protein
MQHTRFYAAFALFALLLPAAGSQAGELKYAAGQGSWQPTQCPRPVRPANLPQDPATAADDLNDRVVSYNAYAAQTQTYLDCVSKEVERDAQAAQYVLTESSKKLMDSAQAELAQIQQQLKKKSRK